MGITKESFGQAYEDIYKFNDIANNFTDVTVESVDNQISFIFSELTEAIDGMENKDGQELLDGAVDVLVTTAGLLAKLEAAGFDVDEAIKRVNANNLSKYLSIEDADKDRSGHKMEYNEEYNVVVLKNEVGKIMKPSNFVPVDLSDCVPANFFGNK